jgi:endonuclease/exonuclease/phosphatase family metal-dependent hydrolase
MGVAFRVVSYNIHGLKDDLTALAATVTELAPDVVVLQEAAGRLRWRTRCARLAHSWGMVHAAGGRPSLGNVIFTSLRVRVVHSWHLHYPLTPGRHLRGAVFARCSVGRTPVVVVGTHLSTDAAERPTQAQLLKKALVDLDAPVVLAGDLNETPGGGAWRMLADGLVDGGAADNEPTFPAREPGRRIDAILSDPRITVAGWRVVGTDTARRASDHLPVVADLVLPDQPATVAST